MAKIVFDIETVGEDFDKLDALTKDALLKYAQNEEEEKAEKDKLGFWPLTAQIIALGMLDVEDLSARVFFQAPGKQLNRFKEKNIEFIPATERGMLGNFWQKIKDCESFITFNGRSFDCPFIMIRSAILKVRPTLNLMPYRYSHEVHIDLLEQLSFYGAMRRRFNLHMWCRAFGIKSPKDKGVCGVEVKDLFRQGKFVDIARYCSQDLIATRNLYLAWEKYLKI